MSDRLSLLPDIYLGSIFSFLNFAERYAVRFSSKKFSVWLQRPRLPGGDGGVHSNSNNDLRIEFERYIRQGDYFYNASGFLDVLHKHDCRIFGSTVPQCLYGERWKGSDLDVSTVRGAVPGKCYRCCNPHKGHPFLEAVELLWKADDVLEGYIPKKKPLVNWGWMRGRMVAEEQAEQAELEVPTVVMEQMEQVATESVELRKFQEVEEREAVTDIPDNMPAEQHEEQHEEQHNEAYEPADPDEYKETEMDKRVYRGLKSHDDHLVNQFADECLGPSYSMFPISTIKYARQPCRNDYGDLPVDGVLDFSVVFEHSSIVHFLQQSSDFDFCAATYDGRRLRVFNWDAIWTRSCTVRVRSRKWKDGKVWGDTANHVWPPLHTEATVLSRIQGRRIKYEQRGFTIVIADELDILNDLKDKIVDVDKTGLPPHPRFPHDKDSCCGKLFLSRSPTSGSLYLSPYARFPWKETNDVK